MNLFWITVTPKLREGIQLINSIDTSKYIVIIQELGIKNEHEDITQENINKWQELLGLDTKSVQLLVQSHVYVLKHSSKIILKPTILQKQLMQDLGMQQNKAVEFVKHWSSLIKSDFASLEQRKKLEDVSWELNIQMLSSSGEKEVDPHVRMKFGLGEHNIQLQLNNDELIEMYNTLESMQHKFDQIQSYNK